MEKFDIYISEIKTLKVKSILHQLEDLFSRFDENYPELFMQAQNGKLSRKQLFECLNLIVDDIRLDDDVTSVHSIVGIYSAILTKQNSISGLKNKTEDLLLERSLSQQEMLAPDS